MISTIRRMYYRMRFGQWRYREVLPDDHPCALSNLAIFHAIDLLGEAESGRFDWRGDDISRQELDDAESLRPRSDRRRNRLWRRVRAYANYMGSQPIDVTIPRKGRFTCRLLCESDGQVTIEIVRNHQPHEPPNVAATH